MKRTILFLFLLLIFVSPASALVNMSNFNMSNATKSMDNLRQMNLTYNDIETYPGFDKLFTVDENNTTAMIDAAFIPVNSYWATDNALGSWFYAVLIIFTVGITYVKTKTMETTSLVLLILALMVALPATVGVFVVPTAMLYLMYICVLLGLVGIFGGLFIEG